MIRIRSWTGRIATAVALCATVLSGTLVVSTPAHAVQLCETEFWWYIDGGNNIFVHNFKICEIYPYERPQGSSIQVHDNFNNWTTVASGYGDIAFYCVTAAASNQFLISGAGIPTQAPFWNRCTV